MERENFESASYVEVQSLAFRLGLGDKLRLLNLLKGLVVSDDYASEGLASRSA